MIKTTGEKLPQQPYRCYNCQLKRASKEARPSYLRHTSCAPPATMALCIDDTPDPQQIVTPFKRAASFPVTPGICAPLPGVAKQPKGCVQLMNGRPSSGKSFRFECQSSSHFLTPHYQGLPGHLPHQDHPCPPCQLEDMRQQGELEVTRQARKEYPQLTVEMLVRNGCIKEWQAKPSWAAYLDERKTEEREMWLHVTRKWTQDLKKARVLVAEEDGLGLLG